MNQLVLILLLMVGLCWHLPAFAEPSTLQIKPHTCVVDAQGVCQVTLQIRFESPTPYAVCFLVRQKQLRFCQPNAAIHELVVQLNVSEKTQIDVVDANNEQVLRIGYLEVASYEPNSTRKRRRFSWSFDQ